MALRGWKKKLTKASQAISSAVESAKSTFKADTPFADVQQELIDDVKKGIWIFTELNLPDDEVEKIQQEIVDFVVDKLKIAWSHPSRIAEEE